MAEAFECPNCRASLVYDAASRRLTVYCDYCNSTVIVPDSLRRMTSGTDSEIIQIENLNEIARLVRAGRISEAIEQVQETFGVGYDEAYEMVDALERNEVVRLGDTAVRITAFDSQEVSSSTLSRSSGRVIGCIVVAILVITLIGVLAPIIGGGAVLFGIFESQRESEPGSEPATSGSLAEVLSDAVDESLPEPSPTPGFASVIHEFGGQEGTGPGFFNDTRQIGVDGQGNIYTGDYDGGRIQTFDSQGNFVDQWHVDSDALIINMAVDRNGIIYLADWRDLLRYDPSGEPLDHLINPGDYLMRAVTVAPDGSIAVFARDRLIRYNRQGQIILDTDPFSELEDFIAIHEDIVVDGSGNMFILSSEDVLRFDTSGNLVDRIGSKGDAADQFQTSPMSLAVDGQGRIYVADFKGILVFDENGRYLDTIPFRGVAFSMTFNDQNQLLVMDRNGNRVVIYELNR